MPPSFDDFFHSGRLSQDYDALLRSKHDFIRNTAYLPPGSDRIDRAQFERQRDQHLRAIHRKVTQDRWEFSPFLEKSVPKANGGERIISIATIRDTLVQRALYRYLYPLVEDELGPRCVAYRRGFGAHDAVQLLRKAIDSAHVYVVDADIQSFFDNVVHDTLKSRLSTLSIDPRAQRLLHLYLEAPRVLSVDRETADRNRPWVRYPRTDRIMGLPQGGVLSGMLANFYLAPFDDDMMRVGEFVRYADDFVVCCRTATESSDARIEAARSLSRLGLTLHPTKTQEYHASNGIQFVGFWVRPGITRVANKNVARFKERFRSVIDKHVCNSALSNDLRTLARKLRYKVQGPVDEVILHNPHGHAYRRSWIGFFRAVDDLQQVRNLDNWICAQVSRYGWRTHRTKISTRDVREAGLPSLMRTLWKARTRNP